MNKPKPEPEPENEGNDMGNEEQNSKRIKFNYSTINSIIGLIVLGVMAWVGTSVLRLTDKVTRLETISEMKVDQLNRIEIEMGRQRDQINALQLDMARIKPQFIK